MSKPTAKELIECLEIVERAGAGRGIDRHIIRLLRQHDALLEAAKAALSELGSFCHAYNVNPETQPAMIQLRTAIADCERSEG